MGRAASCGIALGWVLMILASPSGAADPSAGPGAAQAEFFEARVRPVLASRCFECHGPKKQKGGLRLDSPDAMRTGGDSGAAVIAGDPDHSPLIEAIRHNGDVKMPPKGKLDEAEIAAITEWVRRGASWPASGAETRKADASSTKAITETDRAFWAFQPVKDAPPPQVKDGAWLRTPIDAFILARLEEKSLLPTPRADKRTLIRRATFDLIGLPPTPEEVEAFLGDESPDAFARVVDRLLASPHYGERWGRHWLDVARYGEDQAHSFQPRLYPNGFRYRDWVAQAFNADMPYDRFIAEQIAGDLLDGPGRDERLPALGFFALGPVYYGDPKKFDQVDDRIDTMTRGFLGLTVSCARCHDHKFDPIPTTDYYALAGVFLSTDYDEAPLAPPEQVKAYDAAQDRIKAGTKGIEDFLAAEGARLSRARAVEIAPYLRAAWTLRATAGQVPARTLAEVAKAEGLDPERLGSWATFLEKSSTKDDAAPELAAIGGLNVGSASSTDVPDGETLRAVESFADGLQGRVQALLASREANPSATLAPAEKGLLDGLFGEKGVLTIRKDRIAKELPAESRKALANLKSELESLKKSAPPQYPVMHTLKDGARPADTTVLVRGNPATPGPTAPRRFLTILGGESAPFASGSGRLELARAIASPENPLTARVMVNRIWQHHFGRGLVGTPSNFGELGERPSHPELLDHLAHRFVTNGWSIKSLHREIMRSAAYQQGGQGDERAAEVDPENRLLGRMNRRRLEVEAWRDAILAVSGRLDATLGGPSRKLDDPDNRRRTFYAAVSRHDLAPMLRLFDFPDPNITGAERTRTTVPLQGLVAMNDEFLVQNARALADRVGAKRADGDDVAKIQRAYALLFGRPATESEVRIALDYLSASDPEGSPPADLSRWERYAQALLGTNEFLFVD